MLCNNCNKKLPDDSEFCQYCGKKITNGEKVSKSADNSDKDVRIIEEIQKTTTLLIKSKIKNSNIFINLKTKVKTYSQELMAAGLFSLIIILVFVGEFAFDSHNSSKSNSYDSAYIYDHQTTCDYVLNTSTKKIHRPSCPSAKRISPENYDETNNYSYAILRGYSPCGNCHPYG